MDNNGISIVKPSIEQVQKEVNTELSNKFKKLQEAASHFINQIKSLSNKQDITDHQGEYLKLLETIINNNNQMTNQDIDNISNTFVKQRNNSRNNINTQDILDESFNFQQAINDFLNIKEINIVYVTQEGEIYKINLEQEKELLKKGIFDIETGRVNISKSNFMSLTNINSINFDEKDSQLSLNSTVKELYKKIINKENQEKFISNKKLEKPTPVMYIPKREVIKTKDGKDYTTIYNDLFLVTRRQQKKIWFNHINNWGILKEAYVAALFNVNGEITNSEDEGANMLYDNYIKEVDNLPGIFGGDVSIKKEGQKKSIDYAVKSGNFSSQSYKALINFADYILTNEKVKNILENSKDENDFIQKYHKDLSKINGKINKSIQENLEKIILGKDKNQKIKHMRKGDINFIQ